MRDKDLSILLNDYVYPFVYVFAYKCISTSYKKKILYLHHKYTTPLSTAQINGKHINPQIYITLPIRIFSSVTKKMKTPSD